MKKQLSHVEDDINILKANNTLMKGKCTEHFSCSENLD